LRRIGPVAAGGDRSFTPHAHDLCHVGIPCNSNTMSICSEHASHTTTDDLANRADYAVATQGSSASGYSSC
jgi:hypothetical protein